MALSPFFKAGFPPEVGRYWVFPHYATIWLPIFLLRPRRENKKNSEWKVPETIYAGRDKLSSMLLRIPQSSAEAIY
jgi:hypothetical protein